ncbi:Bug family tripartite tricarboxylate transporter substrate binding protein [Alcaligenes endophyticus]|uniref:Tripartite tricarboxylate transporter substrate binding protein n=1 Tax=Alcaligenes endophyticus TaxID=1929088 RepID=A0ABT8EFZ2_9BURK|nr:tripartite tricarboxylate transporter substrate binding protein [Alcaligenes endophyticus]MCX5590127.1 tripartite tricarboxylate transporter substrate binding protein [Alcaligenes endophyticus]MDN4120210.1 tripartite tricarboxylate transporter substrate binding protein [Alcaligenes endophyticus]
MFKPLLTACLAGSLLLTSALGAQAQSSYPDKAVTVIVPWAAGGSTDILARVISEKLSQSLGEPFVVENRSGASGNIGTNLVAKAKPNGYTLLVGSMSTHTMNQAMYPTMPFDGVKDFTPIAKVALVTNTMVVNPSLPVNTVQEFIDYAKANPDAIAYASAGPGSTNHLSAAMFEKATGINLLHVPYRGGAPAVLDTVGNQTKLLFTAGTQSLPFVKENKLKLLAVTEDQRAPSLPDVPTVAETVSGYELSVWYGFFGPAGMPDDIVKKLNHEINAALQQPDVIAKMESMAVQLLDSTPEQFAQDLQSDAIKYDALIKELGIRLE